MFIVRKIEDLRDYQKFCIKHIIENPFCGLFLDMGLGKTVSALTAVVELLACFEITKPLVIAPKTVAESTWADEVQQWEHLKHLRVVVITGTEKERLEALKRPGDIWVISRDNVVWLQTLLAANFPFDMVIIDESSSFKSEDAKRFKSMKILRAQFLRLVCLTGTPAPNSLLDLWTQLYLIDKGQRLGDNFEKYRQAYFKLKGNGFGGFKGYEVIEAYKQLIYDKISDICISMKSEDYLQLPPCTTTVLRLKMTKAVERDYNIFEREKVLEYVDALEMKNKVVEWYDPFEDTMVKERVNGTITAKSAVSLSGKLLQFASGAVYKEKDPLVKKREFVEFHDMKVQALSEIMEAANGQPVLCFYNFQHDAERIMHALKKYKPHKFRGAKDLPDWNAGKFQLMIAHPASAAHGLNMQYGGHIIFWFGPLWSLELYQQGNKRLDRSGQKHPVQIYMCVISGTMDEDALDTIERKRDGQDGLMNAVKAKVKKHTGKTLGLSM